MVGEGSGGEGRGGGELGSGVRKGWGGVGKGSR